MFKPVQFLLFLVPMIIPSAAFAVNAGEAITFNVVALQAPTYDWNAWKSEREAEAVEVKSDEWEAASGYSSSEAYSMENANEGREEESETTPGEPIGDVFVPTADAIPSGRSEQHEH